MVASTPAVIVVRAPAAEVRVTRSPFRLSFLNAHGRTVLAEVPGGGPGVLAQPPVVDPTGSGIDNRSVAPLYRPLSFLVGTQSVGQYEGGVFGGNLKSGITAGTRYAARRVLQATRAGAGVRLTVSTTDPSGRRLIVTLAPRGPRAIEVRVGFDRAAGVANLGDSFNSARSEAFFGFGGRHNALDQHGEELSGFVQEENVDGTTGFEQGGDGTSLYPNGPTAAYDPQDEFVSSRDYGFLLNASVLARFRMDSDRARAWNVEASSASLDYLITPQPPAGAIGTLTAITGRQPAPPAWALGPMLDRLVKNFGETAADYQANVAADLQNLPRNHVPLTAYRIEGWGFPTPGNDGLALPSYTSPAEQAAVIRTLQRRHIHTLVYLRPWITPGSAPDRAGLTVRTATGQTYLTSSTTSAPIALLDFTNPAAVRFWQREVAKALDLGADGFMQDFGEEVLGAMRFHDGETGASMHNRYLVLYARATRAELTRYARAHRGRQLWFFSRAGFTGTAGAEGANFPGDETNDWTRSSGLPSQTTDMLSRAINGQYGFGTDIGGYYDLTNPPTSKELFLRWAEWAALSPVFRLHGTGRAGTHTPWSYDAQTVRTYDALSALHERAVPLILSLWRAADRTGIPVTRPLWLADPSDRTGYSQDQEWLLGPDVLVAPVVTAGAHSRRAYLPSGCWTSATTHRSVHGRRFVTVPAPLTTLPYFVRCETHPFG